MKNCLGLSEVVVFLSVCPCLLAKAGGGMGVRFVGASLEVVASNSGMSTMLASLMRLAVATYPTHTSERKGVIKLNTRI